MDSTIITAINEKRLLEFSYDGLNRIAEPHVYGVKDGKYELLVYQIRGQSKSGGLPNWRRVELKKVANIQILDEIFPGRRPTPSGKHSSFDRIIAIVK